MLRPTALTMPAVTVDLRLRGAPMASTHSPISTASDLPMVAVFRPLASILMTAMSVRGSEPTSSASYSRLSLKVTVSLLASPATWWLVSM